MAVRFLVKCPSRCLRIKLKLKIDTKGKSEEMLVIGEGMDHFDYKISPCCSPIPGDEVFGFLSIHDGNKDS